MLQLRTLGELRLIGPAGELLAGRRKELVLLAYLVHRAPRPVRRAELMDLLWGERDEQRARHSLRQALLALRRTIGEPLMLTLETVALAADAVELDWATFETAAAAGRWREAVDLWHGDFLPATEDVGAEPFRLWLEAARERARRRLAEVLQRLIADLDAAGDRPAAIAWAERWAELLPLDEQAHRRVVEELYLDGQGEAAQARYAEYAARVRRELGVEPSAAFAQVQRIESGAPRQPASPASGGSAALFTPDLVGREAAQAELRRAWQTVVGGGTAVVVVEGGEGMGKTRLCEEFLRSLDPAGVILHARAPEEAGDAAGSLARELLAGLVAAPGLVGAPELVLAELSRLLPEVRTRWPRLPEPRGSEQALHEATAQAVGAVAHEQPVVLFLDDFSSADAATRRLIVALARRRPPSLLLLLSVRTGGGEDTGLSTDLSRLPGVRHLKLPPLGVPDIEVLLSSMLELPVGQRHALAARLHAESGGNPFYAAEIVSAMVDEGHLAPDARGIWRSNPQLGAGPLPLPSSVREVIRRRLARLGEPAQRVVACVAWLDEPFDLARLTATTGLPPDSVQAALDELLVRRLLRYAPAPRGTLEFAHPMIRRAASERLEAAQRVAFPGPPSRRRARRLALAGLAVATLLAIGAGVVVLSGPPSTVPTLAMGQLEQPEADSLALAAPLGDMLATNLARVPGLPVISRVRMYEILGQLGGRLDVRSSNADAARRAGAAELVEGALQRARSGHLRLVLRRVDLVTGAVRREHTVEAADAFDLADRATAELAAGLGLSPAALRVADVTTASLSAYRLYEAGLRRFGAGDYERALTLFESALTQDSLFAVAALYAWHSGTLAGRPTPVSVGRLDSLAVRAADRERLLIRGAVAFYLQDPRFAAIAETLSVRYPAEPEGQLMLGRSRESDADFLGALPHFWRVIAMDSLALRAGGTSPRCLACMAYAEIANAYLQADSARAAERVAREWIGRQPGAREAWRWLGMSLAIQERFDEAAAALRAAGAASRPDVPVVVTFFPVIFAIVAGDFPTADSSLVELTRRGTPVVQQDALWYRIISLRTQGRLRDALTATERLARIVSREDAGAILQRAQILFELGRSREAALVFDSLAAFPPALAAGGLLARHKSWMLTHLATAHAAAGDTAALDALLEPLRGWGPRSGFGRDRRLHHHAHGLLLAARGRLEDAAAEFRRAIYSSTHGYTRTNYELARVLIALGRPRDAVAVLEPALRGPLDGSGLYVTRTELHERLAYALAEAGEVDRAAALFRRVLAAWRAADPEFHARREAIRERLNHLSRTPAPR